MRNKNTGSTIAHYVIIIAIVSLGLIPLFYLVGKNLVESFQGFQSGLAAQEELKTVKNAADNQGDNKNYLPELAAGSLGGTEETPVAKCEDSNCVVDFGSYVLEGIPENFNELVESSGTSGGTDNLVTLMKQIAAQLKEAGDIEGAEDYKNLANLCHFIAEYEKQTELIVKDCGSSSDPYVCFRQKTNSLRLQIPDNIKALIPDVTVVRGKTEITRIDIAKDKLINNPDNFNEYKTKYPAYAAINLIEKIKGSDKYSDSMKGITLELAQQISNLSVEQSNIIAQLDTNYKNKSKPPEELGKPGDSFLGFNSYDIDTGEYLNNAYIDQNTTIVNLSDIVRPKTSKKTDVKSALICATGWKKDSGKKCQ